MARNAIWRNASKTTASGLHIPEFRLSLPFGEAVLRLPLGFVADERDMNQKTFVVRCTAIGLDMACSTKQTDADKAKEAAVAILKKHLQQTISAYQEDLDSLENIAVLPKTHAPGPQDGPEPGPDVQPPSDTSVVEKPAKGRRKARKGIQKPDLDTDAKAAAAPKKRGRKKSN